MRRTAKVWVDDDNDLLADGIYFGFVIEGKWYFEYGKDVRWVNCYRAPLDDVHLNNGRGKIIGDE